MRRNWAIISIIFLMAGMACKKSQPSKDPNPNGSSELAILMRDMNADLEIIKSEILTGKPLSPMKEHYRRMHKAKPTEGMIDNPEVFQGFSQAFIATWDSLYLPETDQHNQFNRVVNSCVSCHQSYCHGPIQRILKLKIEEE